MAGKEPVRVTISGEEYALRSEKGEEYTRACARHVDGAIRQAHAHGRAVEPEKAAILAALQITDELYTARETGEAQARLVVDRLTALRRRVEEALG